MYHTQSLLEAYYSIYNNKMSDNEMYEIVENYLLENFEFYSQEHLDEMISLLDEETIESIIIEGLKDMSPEDRERWIKSQPDPELARKKLQKYEGEKQEDKKEQGREVERERRDSIFSKNEIRRERPRTQETSQSQEPKKSGIQWSKPSLNREQYFREGIVRPRVSPSSKLTSGPMAGGILPLEGSNVDKMPFSRTTGNPLMDRANRRIGGGQMQGAVATRLAD